MKNSIVSIVTASYNSEAQIRQTYESIKSQSYSSWEWVVTDDCSTDGTYGLLLSIAEKDFRVKVFRNDLNLGAAESRNKSLLNVRGSYIAFIDSDDIWLEDKLLTQLSFMEMGVDFSFTAYELIESSGKRLGIVVDGSQIGSFSYDDMLRKKATMGCSTVMIRRNAFKDLQMPLLRTGQDYAFWLKLLKTGVRAHVVNKVLTQYRILPNSISRNKLKKARRQWQIYREFEQLSVLSSLVNFYFYSFRAVFRK